MTDPDQHTREYPVSGPIDIGRFTAALYAVAAALVSAGYPRPTRDDMPDLAVALGRFLHGIAQ